VEGVTVVIVATLVTSTGTEVAVEIEVAASMGTEVTIGIRSIERGLRERMKRGNGRFHSRLKRIGKLRTNLNLWIRSNRQIRMKRITLDKK
jgi:hypothetical protein